MTYKGWNAIKSNNQQTKLSPLPFSFLDTYSLSTLCLEFNALCIVINFLIICLICKSSSFVHLKDDPEYLTRGTSKEFMPVMIFQPQSLVKRSSLVLLRSVFNFFFFVLVLFECVRCQYSQQLLIFHFSKCPDAFLICLFFFFLFLFSPFSLSS